MADLKISQLSSATALAGTEVVPVVQGGATKKATINQILSPAAGNGIDFSANTGAAGKTSTLLNWYEEGTWTCSVVGQTATATGYYVRIGKIVHVTVDFTCDTDATGTTSSAPISGLPFSASPSQVLTMWVRSADAVSGGGSAPTLTAGSPLIVQTSGTSLIIRPTASTQVNPYYFEDMFNSGSQFIITGSYRV